jgi:hypothetical protein
MKARPTPWMIIFERFGSMRAAVAVVAEKEALTGAIPLS